MKKSSSWRNYEEVAVYLLNSVREELGLTAIEGKQRIRGNETDTEWEIDAKGITANGKGIVIIECRRYMKSRQSQSQAASLAFQINDIAAEGGIFVSPLGLQEGAKKVAAAKNIMSIEIDPDSTPHDFSMKLFDKMHYGVSMNLEINISDYFEPEFRCKCASCNQQFTVIENEKLCPDCSKNA